MFCHIIISFSLSHIIFKLDQDFSYIPQTLDLAWTRQQGQTISYVTSHTGLQLIFFCFAFLWKQQQWNIEWVKRRLVKRSSTTSLKEQCTFFRRMLRTKELTHTYIQTHHLCNVKRNTALKKYIQHIYWN